MFSRLSRRDFLQTGVGSVVGLGITPDLLAQSNTAVRSPNERLHVGIIGVAGRGEANWKGMQAAGAEIVALCDVDEGRTGKAREAVPKAAFFTDFRKLLETKGLDAVVISTPDHTHALPTYLALNAGLHVYCEKPLTHTVAEARLIAETAKKMKRVTQMGTQIHAGENYRRVVELIQRGVLGKIHEVHVWCSTSWGGDGKRPAGEPIPKGLNFDLWLGPAAERPFSRAYVPFHWRRYWDFGGGSLNDMACHYTDLPFWALQLRHPSRVEAVGPPCSNETAPAWLIVRYTYPETKLTWYDGGKRPELVEQKKTPDWKNGVLFVGEKGMLIADYTRHQLLPEKQFEGFKPPEPFIPKSIGHHKEFVEACKTGGPTTCNFDYSGALTEAVLLGTVAYRSGKVLEWDATNLKAKGVPEADAFIHKKYRKGWELS